MKYDALKKEICQEKASGGQKGRQIKEKKTIEIIRKEGGDNAKQVQRYLRISELIFNVDNGEISFNAALELSYLEEK